jgi:hypothetical protein
VWIQTAVQTIHSNQQAMLQRTRHRTQLALQTSGTHVRPSAPVPPSTCEDGFFGITAIEWVQDNCVVGLWFVNGTDC